MYIDFYSCIHTCPHLYTCTRQIPDTHIHVLTCVYIIYTHTYQFHVRIYIYIHLIGLPNIPGLVVLRAPARECPTTPVASLDLAVAAPLLSMCLISARFLHIADHMLLYTADQLKSQTSSIERLIPNITKSYLSKLVMTKAIITIENT